MISAEGLKNFFSVKAVNLFTSMGVYNVEIEFVKNNMDRTYVINICKRFEIHDDKEFLKRNLESVLDKLKDDFYKSITFRRIKDENEKEVSGLQEKIKDLESKIESLQKYKDHYELNYLQAHGKFSVFSKGLTNEQAQKN